MPNIFSQSNYDIQVTHHHILTSHHFLSSLLAVHEPLWDDPWGEELVTLTELLEEDSVGETETADPDTLQHTIAAQLVQNKRGYNLASLYVCEWKEYGFVKYTRITINSTELNVHYAVLLLITFELVGTLGKKEI